MTDAAGRSCPPRLARVAVTTARGPSTPPAVGRGPALPRLVALPTPGPQSTDPTPGEIPEDPRLPLVTLNALPGSVRPGQRTEVLVMAANLRDGVLPEAWLGVVLPVGAELASVTPPAGTVAVTERSGGREVVRTRLAGLAPGSCVGLDVGVTVPGGDGPHRVTAFVTPCEAAEFTLTCEHVLEVDRSA